MSGFLEYRRRLDWNKLEDRDDTCVFFYCKRSRNQAKFQDFEFEKGLAQGSQDREFLDCGHSEFEAIDEINKFSQEITLC